MTIVGSFPVEDLADVELALPVADGQTLVYDATAEVWRNRRIAGGGSGGDGVTPIITAAATVDDTVGSPSVTVTKSGTDEDPHFSFAFSGLKGERGERGLQGEQGIQGERGIPGERGAQGERGIQGERGETGATGATGATGSTPIIKITATVDNTSGTPAVTVTKTGDELEPVFALAFSGLKGADGADGTGGGTAQPYVLPVATASILGGVKIGSGLTIDLDGTLNATGTGAGGNVTVDTGLNENSNNPVTNAAITQAIDALSKQCVDNANAIDATDEQLATLAGELGDAGAALTDIATTVGTLSEALTAVVARIAALEQRLAQYTDVPLTVTDSAGTETARLLLGRAASGG